jgi:hypothetical protein
MPSDVKRENAGAEHAPAVEPPSVKLIVRLFLIPLLIVAGAVGVMWLISRLVGGEPTFDEALQRLKNPGGERTVNYLIGPGSKQRYMDAKTLVDRMKAPGGMSEEERIKLASDLRDILEHYSNDSEGGVRHFILLALGRVWQKASPNEAMNSPAAIGSRRETMQELIKFASSPNVSNRKAAILAMAYWAGRDEVRDAIPLLVNKVRDEKEDLDVRLAAATVLGPIATAADKNVIDALQFALRDTDPAHVELVWGSALSLAELDQADVADTILKLLDRHELSTVKVLNSEIDPNNPTYHTLSDQEQQRILINTMIGAAKLKVPAVQEKLRWIRDNDPSPRVRAAAMQVLSENSRS